MPFIQSYSNYSSKSGLCVQCGKNGFENFKDMTKSLDRLEIHIQLVQIVFQNLLKMLEKAEFFSERIINHIYVYHILQRLLIV